MDQPSIDLNTPENTKRLQALLGGLHKTPALQQQEGLPPAFEASPVRGGKKAGPDLKASLARVLEANKAVVPRPLDQATEQINIQKNDLLKKRAELELKMETEGATWSDLERKLLQDRIDFSEKEISALNSKIMQTADPLRDQQIIQQFMGELRNKKPEAVNTPTKEYTDAEIPTLRDVVHVESEKKEVPPLPEQHEINVAERIRGVAIRQADVAGDTKEGLPSAKEESIELEKEAESLRVEREKIEATKLANLIPESNPEEEEEFQRLEALRNAPPPNPGNPIPSTFEAALARIAERTVQKEIASELVVPVAESLSQQKEREETAQEPVVPTVEPLPPMNEREDAALLEIRTEIDRINKIADKWEKRSVELRNEESVHLTETINKKTEEPKVTPTPLEPINGSSAEKLVAPPKISEGTPTPESDPSKLESAKTKINELTSALLMRVRGRGESALEHVRGAGRWWAKNQKEALSVSLRLMSSVNTVARKVDNVSLAKGSVASVALGTLLGVLIGQNPETENSTTERFAKELSKPTSETSEKPKASTPSPWKITTGSGAPRATLVVPTPSRESSTPKETPEATKGHNQKSEAPYALTWETGVPLLDIESHETPKVAQPNTKPSTEYHSNAFGANLLETPADTMKRLTAEARVPQTPAGASVTTEASPQNPEILKQAEAVLQRDLDELFGSKGIFRRDGIDTTDWKDPRIGFGRKTVREVLGTTSFPMPEKTSEHVFGVDSPESTIKMQAYLRNVALETRIAANTEEKVGDYIKRAVATVISKQIATQKKP